MMTSYLCNGNKTASLYWDGPWWRTCAPRNKGIIGLGNGLSPIQRHAITLTNDDLLWIVSHSIDIKLPSIIV